MYMYIYMYVQICIYIYIYINFENKKFKKLYIKNIIQKKNNNVFWTLHKKINFPLRISSVNVTKSAETAYLVTFAEETLNGKCHFL